VGPPLWTEVAKRVRRRSSAPACLPFKGKPFGHGGCGTSSGSYHPSRTALTIPPKQPQYTTTTPKAQRATRLPNIDPAAWDPNSALSAATVNRLLKHYARRAGLDPRPLHVHTLRHSAAMLEEQTGAGLLAISRLLGHADPKTTIRYLDHLRGQPDTSWAQKCALLDLPGGQP
jgi:hypothetical protein